MATNDNNPTAAASRQPTAVQFNHIPRDILYTIASKLPPKEFVRTSVLSRAWRRPTWQTCPRLTFRLRECDIDRAFWYDHVWRFIDDVDIVLREHRGKVVGTLRVQVESIVGFVPVRFPYSAIDNLVRFAIASRTKNLALDLKPPTRWRTYGADDRYPFPFHLFDDDTMSTPCLQNLQLSFASLKPPPPSHYKGFPNLRKLHLQASHVGSKGLQRVLSRCCSLEWLHLDRCHIHDDVDDDELAVAAPTLPRLRYLRVSYGKLTKIEFNAMNLATFEYNGDFAPIHLIHSTKLQGANIRYNTEIFQEHTLVPLLKGIPRVQNLTLNARLGAIPLLEKRYWLQDSPLLKFSNLKHLQLIVRICHREDFKHILYSSSSFLKATPFIEKLEIHFRSIYGWFDEVGPSREDLGQCKCNNYLKSILITGFRALKGQVEFLLHAVETAPALEVLRVEIDRYPSSLHQQCEEAEEAKQCARTSLSSVLSQDVTFDVVII
ncbi:hypothetical protein U9M48_034680 [Paspalum notatum var. saurae]|uniref:F-box domain-containing protein n=1 Tax=Paspalum notatum var. saurae TaxID=547442 RepID=A0AAQ3UAX9_PASNO